MAKRRERNTLADPLRVFEVHLGSWRVGLDYRAAAHQLADYVGDLGFTHVELLPVAEHPFGGSWGYQVTGYYAPTARFGSPDDFRYFVDHLHRSGIGVIIDWVPAHFPKDDWALARFDGTALYEHADPRLGEHPDWGTLVFNYGRNEVRNFLIANALYWLEEFHIDGLRVDAVASMLYLDYSRKPGEWIPNEHGGRENLDAMRVHPRDEHRRLRRAPRRDDDRRGVDVVAEGEPARSTTAASASATSGTWAGCTTRSATSATTPSTASSTTATSRSGCSTPSRENFVLPLSHDEVVHGKGSLLSKMPGDEWQRFANLRALYGWMWAYPGAQLLFMGGEIGQWTEWSEEHGVDWLALDGAMHRGVQEVVRALNRVSATSRAVWERDHEPAGFQWLDADDAPHSAYGFLRWSADGRQVVACLVELHAGAARRLSGGAAVGRRVAGAASTRTPSTSAGRGTAAPTACGPPTANRIRASRPRPSSRCPRWPRCGSGAIVQATEARSSLRSSCAENSGGTMLMSTPVPRSNPATDTSFGQMWACQWNGPPWRWGAVWNTRLYDDVAEQVAHAGRARRARLGRRRRGRPGPTPGGGRRGCAGITSSS